MPREGEAREGEAPAEPPMGPQPSRTAPSGNTWRTSDRGPPADPRYCDSNDFEILVKIIWISCHLRRTHFCHPSVALAARMRRQRGSFRAEIRGFRTISKIFSKKSGLGVRSDPFFSVNDREGHSFSHFCPPGRGERAAVDCLARRTCRLPPPSLLCRGCSFPGSG